MPWADADTPPDPVFVSLNLARVNCVSARGLGTDDHNPNTTGDTSIEQSSTMSEVNVASKELDSIESKVSPSR